MRESWLNTQLTIQRLRAQSFNNRRSVLFYLKYCVLIG